MKKALIAIALAAVATATWAACSTSSYTVNGKTVYCSTCCHGKNCTTNCY